MQLPDLSSLPPWALVIFAVSLAVIVAVVWFGKQQGGRSGHATDGTKTVELAVATIDSTAIKQVAAAVEALGVAIHEQNKAYRDHSAAMLKAIDELKDELRHQGEAMRR